MFKEKRFLHQEVPNFERAPLEIEQKYLQSLQEEVENDPDLEERRRARLNKINNEIARFRENSRGYSLSMYRDLDRLQERGQIAAKREIIRFQEYIDIMTNDLNRINDLIPEMITIMGDSPSESEQINLHHCRDSQEATQNRVTRAEETLQSIRNNQN